MKICLAQICSLKGDIAANILHHQKFIILAVEKRADAIFFPELSITGYEPTLAKKLATNALDSRFDIFQQLANLYQLVIGIGVPTQSVNGQCISMLAFQPNQDRWTYSKQYLHEDELPFFEKGNAFKSIDYHKEKLGLAICYEVFVEDHAEQTYKNGANIYIASVAKPAKGIQKAMMRMPEIAKKYNMPVLMANSVGLNDDFISIGQSSVWNQDGILVGQLNDTEEGILVYDTINKQLC